MKPETLESTTTSTLHPKGILKQAKLTPELKDQIVDQEDLKKPAKDSMHFAETIEVYKIDRSEPSQHKAIATAEPLESDQKIPPKHPTKIILHELQDLYERMDYLHTAEQEPNCTLHDWLMHLSDCIFILNLRVKKRIRHNRPAAELRAQVEGCRKILKRIERIYTPQIQKLETACSKHQQSIDTSQGSDVEMYKCAIAECKARIAQYKHALTTHRSTDCKFMQHYTQQVAREEDQANAQTAPNQAQPANKPTIVRMNTPDLPQVELVSSLCRLLEVREDESLTKWQQIDRIAEFALYIKKNTQNKTDKAILEDIKNSDQDWEDLLQEKRKEYEDFVSSIVYELTQRLHEPLAPCPSPAGSPRSESEPDGSPAGPIRDMRQTLNVLTRVEKILKAITQPAADTLVPPPPQELDKPPAPEAPALQTLQDPAAPAPEQLQAATTPVPKEQPQDPAATLQPHALQEDPAPESLPDLQAALTPLPDHQVPQGANWHRRRSTYTPPDTHPTTTYTPTYTPPDSTADPKPPTTQTQENTQKASSPTPFIVGVLTISGAFALSIWAYIRYSQNPFAWNQFSFRTIFTKS